MPDLFGYDHYSWLSRSAGLSDCGRYRYWLRRSWRREATVGSLFRDAQPFHSGSRDR